MQMHEWATDYGDGKYADQSNVHDDYNCENRTMIRHIIMTVIRMRTTRRMVIMLMRTIII